jgi:hypothetical protein
MFAKLHPKPHSNKVRPKALGFVHLKNDSWNVFFYLNE